MEYIIKHSSNLTFKSLRNQSSSIFKALFCDKKDNVIKTLEQTEEDKKSEAEPSEKSREEIETFLFENEEKILQIVSIEKEKDASIRSLLSKECNRLLDRKIRLTSVGLNLHLDQNTTQNTCWEDYMFDTTTVNHLKCSSAASGPDSMGICERTDPLRKKKRKGTKGGDGTSPPDGKRIVRGEPGKVLFAFIPEEWFYFFLPKTGATGLGTFFFSFGTFLLSKEYYVLEHNYYNGLGMVAIIWAALKYVGPQMARFLDKEVENYEKSWQQGRDLSNKLLEEQISDEKLLHFQADGQLMLVEAKRENVQLQLEEEFRKRQMTVYQEVLKRLNYHVDVGLVYKKIFHRNLVDYVTREVQKSITPELEKEMFNISISALVAELQTTNKV